jgi:hypothetical protein
MAFRSILVAIFLLSACRADKIACPEITVVKLKTTHIRPGQLKKGAEEEKLSASVRYRPSDFMRRTDVKKAADVDEWDCPEPGKIQKVAREQRKRMEKHLKAEQKKRREFDTLSVFPVR